MAYSFLEVGDLRGQRITLRRIRLDELEETGRALVSPTTYFTLTRFLDTPQTFVTYYTPRIAQQDKGELLTFLARDNKTNEIVATSTFQFAGVNFSKVEIGFTWVVDKWHRTHVNTEMKFLMLQHAFEVMKTGRVEFFVRPDNEKSNKAVKRIGAIYEGCLRNWRYLNPTDTGTRNVYSILAAEWPEVKTNLLKKLSP